jgi:hypothetical protein
VTPPAWSDIAWDLAAARDQAGRAQAKDASLAAMADAGREDRELAIGKHLHDAVSAIERALERLVQDVDGDLPRGGRFHQDLLDRAARPLPGLRPAILSAETRRALGLLIGFRHAFRHAYGTYDYVLAQPNVAIAAAAVPRAAAEIEAFAAAIGLAQAP